MNKQTNSNLPRVWAPETEADDIFAFSSSGAINKDTKPAELIFLSHLKTLNLTILWVLEAFKMDSLIWHLVGFTFFRFKKFKQRLKILKITYNWQKVKKKKEGEGVI